MVGHRVAWVPRDEHRERAKDARIFERRLARERRPESPAWAPSDVLVARYEVEAQHDGLRLDRFLCARIPRLSRSRVQKIIRTSTFRRDGSRPRASDIVHTGQEVFLVRDQLDEPSELPDLVVVHDDGELFALDKPAGIAMHPTAKHHRNTLTAQLRERYPDARTRPVIAHRLDLETSGLVLCGRTPRVERALKEAFLRRAVTKTYVAIVWGQMADDEGEIDRPLELDPTSRLRVVMRISDSGLHALTRYRVRARRDGGSNDGYTLVELSPQTGRQHQLRVHLSSIGHPIVGDKLYGPSAEWLPRSIRDGVTQDLLDALELPRHALHAESAELLHPTSGERLRLVAPLATDLRAFWDQSSLVTVVER